MEINNKLFEKWNSDDLNALLDNDAFRENDLVDYKSNFAFLEIQDKIEKRHKQDEFRHDICSFANSDGGYMFFGISEAGGIANKILGITIPNDDTDKFELDRRNDISKILPVIPYVDFKFIKIEANRYIVVLHVLRGYYKPYVCQEGEDKYKFFIRRGNKKQSMSYSELRSIFNQSLTLADEIKRFREETAKKWMDQQIGIYMLDIAPPFALIQVIPETFRNSDCFIDLYQMISDNKILAAMLTRTKNASAVTLKK